MTTDPAAALAAAQRLAEALPSSKHRLDEGEPKGGPHAVEIDGVVYPSMRQGAAAHGISIGALVKWVEKGRASYV